ncbi:hypothetical protein [Streptomyces sp. NRRL F-5126]|uniref:hypothetical protein n=1 Tax=Streptomyces sp. NRRL F-5126 TaxID=1463857 RepID=UPI0004C65947|nr:hypothetical protein [Streptomyces sp. NRRL F-5126]
MADDDPNTEVTCAAGCDTSGPAETMTLMPGGQYQCDQCTGAVIARGSLDEVPLGDDDGLTRPIGDPDEAAHRGAA